MFLKFGSIALLLLTGCSPGFFSAAEDIATQEAISLKVDREALQKDTDVRISVEVINKDPAVNSPSSSSSPAH
jgi:hypothetical protein